MFKKLIFFALIGSFLFSCKKEKEFLNPNNVSYTSTQDNSQSQSAYDDVNDQVQEAFEQAFYPSAQRTSGSVTSGCATLTFPDTQSYPDTMYVDFDGSTCSDFKKRSGRLQIIYDGLYRDAGTTITTTLINYSVNGTKVEGTHVVKNKGANTDGNTEFEVKVTNGKLTYSDNTSSTWSSTRTRVWVEGESTTGLAGISDDVYDIYGTANGVNREGLAYTMTVNKSDALRYELSCILGGNYLPTQGILTLSPDGLTDRVIDYGSGDCDSKIKVSIGALEIELGYP